MSNQKNHEKANEYRDLCNVAGEVLKGRNVTLPSGYRVLEKENGKRKFNFKSVVYEKGNEVVICYLGTDILSGKDNVTNLKMGVSSKPSAQMENANKLCENIKNKYPNSSITVIGHSEGGSEAMYAGLNNKVTVVTFNACGLHDDLAKKFNKEDADRLITNYRHPNDPISKLRPLLGDTYIVESKREIYEKYTPYGVVTAHRISNFGDCTNAQDVDSYKKEHKGFVNCIRELVITRKDIANMPNELYQIYDAEISERLSKGQIYTVEQAEKLVSMGNLVKVSDYEREDGTHVDGYYRHKPNTVY